MQAPWNVISLDARRQQHRRSPATPITTLDASAAAVIDFPIDPKTERQLLCAQLAAETSALLNQSRADRNEWIAAKDSSNPSLPKKGETMTLLAAPNVQFTAGAFDALVNHALVSVKCDAAQKSPHGVAAYNLDGSADEAFQAALWSLADDPCIADLVMTSCGFELGLNIARVVMQAPLADHRSAIKDLLERHIGVARAVTARRPKKKTAATR